MKRYGPWFLRFCLVLIGLVAIHATPVYAQSDPYQYFEDDEDGIFVDQYTAISVDNFLNLDSYTDLYVEYDDYWLVDAVGADFEVDEDGTSIYYDPGYYDYPGLSIGASGTVPSGHEYMASSIGVVCFYDEEFGDDCEEMFYTYDSVTVGRAGGTRNGHADWTISCRSRSQSDA